MRIAMFRPALATGSLGALVHQDFRAEVVKLGHEFDVLTTRRPGSAGDSFAIGSVLPTSPAWRLADRATAPWLRTTALLSPAAALRRYLETSGDDVDLLHVEMAYPFGAAAMLAVAASGWKGPVAVTPMGEDTLVLEECAYGFRRHALPRRLVDGALRRAAGLRCISPLHERHLAALAPSTRRQVIPLNVSQAVVDAAAESASVREARKRATRQAVDAEHGTTGKFVVLSLGRLHPFKGLDVLIGAIARVPDVVLLVAGPSLAPRNTGDEATRLRRLAVARGVADRVRFLGRVSASQALRLIAAADVVAIPSRLESLNKVAVEAASVGTPFIVTETTGVAAWARDFAGATIVPPGDEPALARALHLARETPWPADGESIRRFVAHFSPASVAAEVVGFYDELLRGRAP